MPSTRQSTCSDQLLADAWLKRSRSFEEMRENALHQIWKRESAILSNYVHAFCLSYSTRTKRHGYPRFRAGGGYKVKKRRTPVSLPPPENIAAIKLLESWLSRPEINSGDRAEAIRQRIDENRLSDRKFFT